MAVLVMEMINARTSGVEYSRDPARAVEDNLVVHAVEGGGDPLVGGEVTPLVIRVDKSKAAAIQPGRGQVGHAPRPGGSDLGMDASAREAARRLGLGDNTLGALASWTTRLEDFFAGPQDIEWCVDRQKRRIRCSAWLRQSLAALCSAALPWRRQGLEAGRPRAPTGQLALAVGGCAQDEGAAKMPSGLVE